MDVVSEKINASQRPVLVFTGSNSLTRFITSLSISGARCEAARIIVTDVCWDRLSESTRELSCKLDVRIKVAETSIGRQSKLDRIMCRTESPNIEVLALVDFLTADDGITEEVSDDESVVLVRNPDSKWQLFDLPANMTVADPEKALRESSPVAQ